MDNNDNNLDIILPLESIFIHETPVRVLIGIKLVLIVRSPPLSDLS